MATPLESAQQRLDAYLAAETAILTGAQEYRFEGRTVRKGDLVEIRAAIEKLQGQVADLQAAATGGCRLRVGVPAW